MPTLQGQHESKGHCILSQMYLELLHLCAEPSGDDVQLEAYLHEP